MKFEYIKALSLPIAEDIENLSNDFKGSPDSYLEITQLEAIDDIRTRWPIVAEIYQAEQRAKQGLLNPTMLYSDAAPPEAQGKHD